MPSDTPIGEAGSTPSRRSVLLRLNPEVADALARWASDELRSTNAHIELLLRRSLAEAGRLPARIEPIAKRGRPAKRAPAEDSEHNEHPSG